MLTALGVGGLAVALALQDTLANLFAGIHILASKTVQPGDYIRLSSGEEGYVEDINWRQTTVRALSNNLVVIPNGQLAKTNMTNFMRPEQQLTILVQVGVAYDSDLEHVERVTTEVVAEVMTEITGASRTMSRPCASTPSATAGSASRSSWASASSATSTGSSTSSSSACTGASGTRASVSRAGAERLAPAGRGAHPAAAHPRGGGRGGLPPPRRG